MEIGRAERAALEAIDAAAGAFSRPLLLDFEATTASDTSTIASLVEALRRRVAAHARVAIINAPPRLVAELEITRLRDMFPVYASEDEALAVLVEEVAQHGTPNAERPSLCHFGWRDLGRRALAAICVF